MSSQQIDTGTDELLCLVDERVATITLNRPEKRNALSDHLTPALRQTLFDLETRNDVGCIVITGAGTAFCAGGDVGGDLDRRLPRGVSPGPVLGFAPPRRCAGVRRRAYWW